MLLPKLSCHPWCPARTLGMSLLPHTHSFPSHHSLCSKRLSTLEFHCFPEEGRESHSGDWGAPQTHTCLGPMEGRVCPLILGSRWVAGRSLVLQTLRGKSGSGCGPLTLNTLLWGFCSWPHTRSFILFLSYRESPLKSIIKTTKKQ